MNSRFITNFLKGSASSFMGNACSILFHFLSIMIITRFVDKVDFGIYLFILVITQGIKLFSSLGLDLTLVKFMVDNQKEKNDHLVISIVSARFVLIIIFTVFTLAFGNKIFGYFDIRISQYLVFIPIIFALANIRELMFHFLQGAKLFKKYAIVQIFSALLKFCLISFAVLFFTLSIKRLLIIEITTLFLSLLLLLFYAKIQIKSLSDAKYKINKEIFNFSFPLYLNNISRFLYSRVSVLMIAALLTPVHIAYFELARKLSEALTRLFKSFIVVYFPNLSALFSQGDFKDGEKLMNKSLVLISNFILPVVLVGFLFRNEITVILFSREYLVVSFALFLLLLKFYFQSISKVLGFSIVSLGYPSAPVKVTIISSVLHVVLSYPLIKIYGFIGAVYSVLLVSIFSMFLYLSFFKNDVKPAVKTYLNPFWKLLITIAMYWIIGNEHFLIKLFFILAYFILNLSFIKSLKSLWHTIFNHLIRYKLQVKSN